MLRKGSLFGAALALVFSSSAGADTVVVVADAQINMTSVAAKGGTLPTASVKNTLPGAALRTFARFDLGALPSGLPVTKATLRMWVNLVTTEGSVDVVAVLGPWDEATLTAITAPPLSNLIQDFTVTKKHVKTYVTVDITSLVQDWVSGNIANHGLALLGSAQEPVNARFDSKESTTTSHPMELEVALGLPAGSGDITSINPGFGLTGGGNLGDVTLSVNPNQIQQRVQTECPAGSSIRRIEQNGTVVCQSGDITGVAPGFGLFGGSTAGDATLTVDTALIQRRVAAVCPGGTSIRAIDINGNPSCETDNTIVDFRGRAESGIFTLAPAPTFICRTTPYTAIAGDRAHVWVAASCGIVPGQAFSVRVGTSTGNDSPNGITMPATNTGTINGYLHSSQWGIYSLTDGSTYTFTTAINNPFGSTSAQATCYCNTQVQIVR